MTSQKGKLTVLVCTERILQCQQDALSLSSVRRPLLGVVSVGIAQERYQKSTNRLFSTSGLPWPPKSLAGCNQRAPFPCPRFPRVSKLRELAEGVLNYRARAAQRCSGVPRLDSWGNLLASRRETGDRSQEAGEEQPRAGLAVSLQRVQRRQTQRKTSAPSAFWLRDASTTQLTPTHSTPPNTHRVSRPSLA